MTEPSPDATRLGFSTPSGSTDIRTGDDSITTNANVTAALHMKLERIILDPDRPFPVDMAPLPRDPLATVVSASLSLRNHVIAYVTTEPTEVLDLDALWTPLVSERRHILSPLVVGPDYHLTPGSARAITRDRARWSDLIAYGDSITESIWGSSPNTIAWPAVTADRLGIAAANLGHAGWTSTELAVVYGALPLDLILPAQLPATGAVACTTLQDGAWNDQARSWPGRVLIDNQWHPVILHKAATRGEAPASIEQRGATGPLVGPGAVPVRFVADVPIEQADRPAVFMWGRNNLSAGWNLDIAKRDTLALARMLDERQTPWVAMTLTNRTSEPAGSTGYQHVMAFNAWLTSTWPRNTFDARGYLVTYGLTAAGITPTAADEQAMSEDRIPPSLLWDGEVHPNDAGETVIGEALADWIKTTGVTP